ncbi:hypothetical protein NLC35_02010 [Candidatus Aminicenantes bacterium AC-334-K16]|jgi:hypothetical protein|nr:hypothetical protein [Candidatus Aminicenantes bacterium AC-334-K16]
MKKPLLVLLGVVFLAFCLLIISSGAKTGKGKFSECTKIQDGILTYASGHYLEGKPIKPGFDMYGYNYQAHLFNGYYCNVYLGKDGFPPYEGDSEAYLKENPDAASKWYWPHRDILLSMKWNDVWLSNKDCDGDGKLDRHFGFDSYIGSGAWLTNHMFGTYTNEDGEECHWNYFVKIIAVPEDAYRFDGVWYTADGTEIGPVIWGLFAIIQQISNDPCAGEHGALYVSPAGPGFGKWK